jgi:hypothetical protein
MTAEQQHIEQDKELAAAEQQLNTALGLDHEELLQREALQRTFSAMFNERSTRTFRQVRQHAWLQRLGPIMPELVSRIDCFFVLESSEILGELWPCSLEAHTNHSRLRDWGEEKAECQAIAERLAELLATVPGPIESVIVPIRHDSSLAEVAVKRSSEQLEAGQ